MSALPGARASASRRPRNRILTPAESRQCGSSPRLLWASASPLSSAIARRLLSTNPRTVPAARCAFGEIEMDLRRTGLQVEREPVLRSWPPWAGHLHQGIAEIVQDVGCRLSRRSAS